MTTAPLLQLINMEGPSKALERCDDEARSKVGRTLGQLGPTREHWTVGHGEAAMQPEQTSWARTTIARLDTGVGCVSVGQR